jgi:hypothetical protein
MERIFNPKNGTALKVVDDMSGDEVAEEYNKFITTLMEDTVDYEESFLAPQRDIATRYYNGLAPTLESTNSPDEVYGDPDATYDDLDDAITANRSTIVSTDVRDAILNMLPSLIRIFGATEKPVNLVATSEEGVEVAEQATDYVNHVFWNDNPGFLILYSVFKDALTVKTGFVKWWSDTSEEMVEKTFQFITAEQLQQLISEQPDVQIVDYEVAAPGLLAHITLKFKKSKPLTKVGAVPPEEMRLDRQANSFYEQRIVGHEKLSNLSELRGLGYDEEMLLDYVGASKLNINSDERFVRNPGADFGYATGDGIIYGEWYVRADKDGDGIAELRHICTIGEERHIIHDEPANRIKFALFSCDPIPHTIVGDSVADLAIDIQRIKTNVFRGVLDSLAESINPKTVVNELTTNLDDALNDDLGAVIRTRGDPNTAVAFSNTPFVGQQAIPVIEQLDMLLSRRTGQTDASKGLDPKSLQSSTTLGVDAIISGAQERTELVARVLCETGFVHMFRGIYDEICENPNQERIVKIRGKFVNFNTSLFDASVSIEVNPTMGKGTDFVRMNALMGIKQDQLMVMDKYGPTNPFVTPVELLNTVTDLLEIANIRNVSRYFKTPTPEVMEQIMNTPQEPDPMTVAAKAQFEKVRSDTADKVGKQQHADEKLKADDDFRRDKLAMDNLVKLIVAGMKDDQEAKKIEAVAQNEADTTG